MSLPHLRDISNNQGPVDWRLEKKRVAGVYVKVTQGAGFTDPTAKRRISNATAAGMFKVGGYHYAIPGSGSPELQADRLIANAPLAPGRLRPCLDCEDNTLRLQPQQLAAWYAACVLRLRQRLGYYPTIYGSPSYLTNFATSDIHAAAVFGQCPLWIADYGVAKPAVPAPWVSWAAWQWTDKQEDPAVGRVDDSFAADLPALTIPYTARGTWILPPSIR